MRAHDQIKQQEKGTLTFPIQGQGTETRSFIGIDDFIEGLMVAIKKGQHQEIYHIGTEEEIAIADVARKIAKVLGREIEIQPGPITPGSAIRRCPDISKIRLLGYNPKLSFDEALSPAIDWYTQHADERPN